MSKESLNRAQRRRRQREAREHVPTFWDSMFNRVWVIALGAIVLGIVIYGAVPKSSQTATKPAAPPQAPPQAPPAATTAPTPPATPPTSNEKVKIEDLKVGSGAEAKPGDHVTVQYTGTLDNGTKFDSSYDKGQPLTCTLGPGIIEGWVQGIAGMKEGGKRKLTIPPSLGYGSTGKGQIPPNATLHFDIELVKIEPKP